jgi:transglutaminase-like putative cysteine protease
MKILLLAALIFIVIPAQGANTGVDPQPKLYQMGEERVSGPTSLVLPVERSKEGVIIRRFTIDDATAIDVRISSKTYLYYKLLRYRPPENSYADYVRPNDVQHIAQALRREYPSPWEYAEAALRLVQQISPEEDIDPWDTKYPLETLAEGAGDCEDTSILYASLIRAGGLDAVLIETPWGEAGHMLTGVALPEPPSSHAAGVVVGGIAYWFAETTSPGWRLGELPSQLREGIREAKIWRTT